MTIPVFRAEALGHARNDLTVTQEVSPAITDPIAVGSSEEATTTVFATSTPGVMQLIPFCYKTGSSIQVSVSATTSLSAFTLVGASYLLSSLSSTAQNISPLSLAGGCVFALEAWVGNVKKIDFDGDLEMEFDLTAAEYDRFTTGKLSLYTFATTTSQWVEMTGVTRDDSAHTLRASFNHLSLFAALGTLLSSSTAAQASTSQQVTASGGSSRASSLPVTPPILAAPTLPASLAALISALVSQVQSSVTRVIAPRSRPPGGLTNEAAAPTTTNAPNKPSVIPKSLFDIRVETTASRYTPTEDPEVVIVFDNFGATTTAINIIFSLQDSSGKEISRSSDRIVIETQGVYRKKFPRLATGDYRLVVQTNYSQKVNDKFNLRFSVSPQGGFVEGLKQYWEAGKFESMINALRLLSILAILFTLVLSIMRRWRGS